jgi:plastocyanin
MERLKRGTTAYRSACRSPGTNKQQGVAHIVTADGGVFDHSMPSGAMFSFTFAKAGTFAYHCTIHPSMHGTIMVS